MLDILEQQYSYIFMLREAGQTAGLIGLKKLWTLTGGGVLKAKKFEFKKKNFTGNAGPFMVLSGYEYIKISTFKTKFWDFQNEVCLIFLDLFIYSTFLI